MRSSSGLQAGAGRPVEHFLEKEKQEEMLSTFYKYNIIIAFILFYLTYWFLLSL